MCLETDNSTGGGFAYSKGTKVASEIPPCKRAFRIAAITMGIIALVSIIALCVIAAAPAAIMSVGFIASAIAFMGGTGNVLIAFGIATGVSFVAGCLFNTMYKRE